MLVLPSPAGCEEGMRRACGKSPAWDAVPLSPPALLAGRTPALGRRSRGGLGPGSHVHVVMPAHSIFHAVSPVVPILL